MPDINKTIENSEKTRLGDGGNNIDENSAHKIPNPFEKGHPKLPAEALDNIEQYKEAQTERD